MAWAAEDAHPEKLMAAGTALEASPGSRRRSMMAVVIAARAPMASIVECRGSCTKVCEPHNRRGTKAAATTGTESTT
jgi:hypothetical protein